MSTYNVLTCDCIHGLSLNYATVTFRFQKSLNVMDFLLKNTFVNFLVQSNKNKTIFIRLFNYFELQPLQPLDKFMSAFLLLIINSLSEMQTCKMD